MKGKKGSSSYPRPYKGQLVYLNVTSARLARSLEADLRLLGARIEKCFSKDVTLVVSDAAAGAGGMCGGSGVAGSPRLSAPSPSPLTPAGMRGSLNSPHSPSAAASTGINQLSRAAKMLSSANVTKNHGSSNILKCAERMNITVVSSTTLAHKLKDDVARVPAHITAASDKEKGRAERRRGEGRDHRVKALSGRVVKCEDCTRHFRPVWQDVADWPRIHTLQPAQACPFERRKGTAGQPAGTEEDMEGAELPGVKDAAHDCLTPLLAEAERTRDSTVTPTTLPGQSRERPPSLSAQHASGKRTHSKKSAKQQGGAAETRAERGGEGARYTAAELRRIMVEKRRALLSRGYCEMCALKYDDINQHLRSDSHRRFVRCADNFAALDAVIASGPDMAQFLQDTLTYHRLHVQQGKEESEMEEEVLLIREGFSSPLVKPRPGPSLPRVRPLNTESESGPGSSKVQRTAGKRRLIDEGRSVECAGETASGAAQLERSLHTTPTPAWAMETTPARALDTTPAQPVTPTSAKRRKTHSGSRTTTPRSNKRTAHGCTQSLSTTPRSDKRTAQGCTQPPSTTPTSVRRRSGSPRYSTPLSAKRVRIQKRGAASPCSPTSVKQTAAHSHTPSKRLRTDLSPDTADSCKFTSFESSPARVNANKHSPELTSSHGGRSCERPGSGAAQTGSRRRLCTAQHTPPAPTQCPPHQQPPSLSNRVGDGSQNSMQTKDTAGCKIEKVRKTIIAEEPEVCADSCIPWGSLRQRCADPGLRVEGAVSPERSSQPPTPQRRSLRGPAPRGVKPQLASSGPRVVEGEAALCGVGSPGRGGRRGCRVSDARSQHSHSSTASGEGGTRGGGGKLSPGASGGATRATNTLVHSHDEGRNNTGDRHAEVSSEVILLTPVATPKKSLRELPCRRSRASAASQTEQFAQKNNRKTPRKHGSQGLPCKATEASSSGTPAAQDSSVPCLQSAHPVAADTGGSVGGGANSRARGSSPQVVLRLLRSCEVGTVEDSASQKHIWESDTQGSRNSTPCQEATSPGATQLLRKTRTSRSIGSSQPRPLSAPTPLGSSERSHTQRHPVLPSSSKSSRNTPANLAHSAGGETPTSVKPCSPAECADEQKSSPSSDLSQERLNRVTLALRDVDWSNIMFTARLRASTAPTTRKTPAHTLATGAENAPVAARTPGLSTHRARPTPKGKIRGGARQLAVSGRELNSPCSQGRQFLMSFGPDSDDDNASPPSLVRQVANIIENRLPLLLDSDPRSPPALSPPALHSCVHPGEGGEGEGAGVLLSPPRLQYGEGGCVEEGEEAGRMLSPPLLLAEISPALRSPPLLTPASPPGRAACPPLSSPPMLSPQRAQPGDPYHAWRSGRPRVRRRLPRPVRVLTGSSLQRLFAEDAPQPFLGFTALEGGGSGADLSFTEITECELTDFSDYELDFGEDSLELAMAGREPQSRGRAAGAGRRASSQTGEKPAKTLGSTSEHNLPKYSFVSNLSNRYKVMNRKASMPESSANESTASNIVTNNAQNLCTETSKGGDILCSMKEEKRPWVLLPYLREVTRMQSGRPAGQRAVLQDVCNVTG